MVPTLCKFSIQLFNNLPIHPLMSFCQFLINASNTNLDRDADNLQIEKSHYLILSVIPESLLMAMGSVYLNNKKNY